MNDKRLDEIITESINEVLHERVGPYSSTQQGQSLLTEIARINRNEQNIFPYQSYLVEVRSNDHNPPHFHVVYNNCDVSFTIEDGNFYRVSRGNPNADYTRLENLVKKWLTCKSVTRPQTNQENAWETWHDLHG